MTAPTTDPMAELFDWIGRVIVRFDRDYHQRQSAGAALLRHFNADLGGPDLVPIPRQEDSARRAFETAILGEPLPAWLALCCLHRGGALSTAQQIKLFSSLPVGFQDVPGAAAALQSVLGSNDFPIVTHFGDQKDSRDAEGLGDG